MCVGGGGGGSSLSGAQSYGWACCRPPCESSGGSGEEGALVAAAGRGGGWCRGEKLSLSWGEPAEAADKMLAELSWHRAVQAACRERTCCLPRAHGQAHRWQVTGWQQAGRVLPCPWHWAPTPCGDLGQLLRGCVNWPPAEQDAPRTQAQVGRRLLSTDLSTWKGNEERCPPSLAGPPALPLLLSESPERPAPPSRGGLAQPVLRVPTWQAGERAHDCECGEQLLPLGQEEPGWGGRTEILRENGKNKIKLN